MLCCIVAAIFKQLNFINGIIMIIAITIDRFEEDNAVLKSEDRQTIIWPKKLLPAGAHEGAVLSFNIHSSKEAEELKKAEAKDILNEIINIE